MSSSTVTISSTILYPTTSDAVSEYLLTIVDCASVNTKKPLAKYIPCEIENRVPRPTAGLTAVFVVCTLSVTAPFVIVSPGVNLTDEAPATPAGAFVYAT